MGKWILKNMNVVRVAETEDEAAALKAKGFKLVRFEPCEDVPADTSPTDPEEVGGGDDGKNSFDPADIEDDSGEDEDGNTPAEDGEDENNTATTEGGDTKNSSEGKTGGKKKGK